MSDKTDGRYVNYPDNKRSQKTVVSEISILELQAKNAAQTKTYNVQIIKGDE